MAAKAAKAKADEAKPKRVNREREFAKSDTSKKIKVLKKGDPVALGIVRAGVRGEIWKRFTEFYGKHAADFVKPVRTMKGGRGDVDIAVARGYIELN